MDRIVLYIFGAIGLLPLFFPKSIIDTLQIGDSVVIYRKLGVHLVNQVTQNGIIINKLIKKRFPAYKSVAFRPSSIHKLIGQTYALEKFHLALFVFYSLTMVYALVHQQFGWAFIILMTNLIYNVYPNLLQQYIRLKLVVYRKKIQSVS
ncbi:glycosyl-4,4'-diaponeurosporenoate acyltransferase CrtO family protein [Rufibacter immobilis]|uniref:glycosyl-4,4'-diaponeurosporenoate acyltransferase CrtO family protein n=1 Tax=Rufibacter immobilis TaxID=1348778 RepID=UPI0035E7965C